MKYKGVPRPLCQASRALRKESARCHGKHVCCNCYENDRKGIDWWPCFGLTEDQPNG